MHPLIIVLGAALLDVGANMAINRQDMVDMLQGVATAAYNTLIDSQPWYGSPPVYEYDPDGARALLEFGQGLDQGLPGRVAGAGIIVLTGLAKVGKGVVAGEVDGGHHGTVLCVCLNPGAYRQGGLMTHDALLGAVTVPLICLYVRYNVPPGWPCGSFPLSLKCLWTMAAVPLPRLSCHCWPMVNHLTPPQKSRQHF